MGYRFVSQSLSFCCILIRDSLYLWAISPISDSTIALIKSYEQFDFTLQKIKAWFQFQQNPINLFIKKLLLKLPIFGKGK